MDAQGPTGLPVFDGKEPDGGCVRRPGFPTAFMAAGFDGYQTKPINVREFLGAVERALGGTR